MREVMVKEVPVSESYWIGRGIRFRNQMDRGRRVVGGKMINSESERKGSEKKKRGREGDEVRTGNIQTE